MIVLEYDNKGEGGSFSLLSLLPEFKKTIWGRFKKFISVALMIMASSFIISDGVLTPAISILSALEGLSVYSSSLQPAIVPISCVIVVGLFIIQSYGTEFMGLIFGPFILLYMMSIAIMGLYNIVVNWNTNVFRFFNPYYIVLFFENNKSQVLVMIGGIFLCMTGVEAMYADLGHFGKHAVRISALFIVVPCLLLTYIGQASFLLNNPTLYSTTFYSSIPPYPSVFWANFVLSTIATIIASQALISATFSLVSQAIKLNFFPKIKVKHTSKELKGQVYIPLINYLLMIIILIVIIVFQHSASLASAYGIAVATVLVITSFSLIWVNYERSWILYDKEKVQYSPNTYKWYYFFGVQSLVSFMILPFIAIELLLLASALTKIPNGGYFVILMAFCIIIIMSIWTFGQWYLSYRVTEKLKMDLFIKMLDEDKLTKLPNSTGVYVNQRNFFDEKIQHDEFVPVFVVDFIKHMEAYHENIIFITLKFYNDPFFTEENRYEFEKVRDGVYQIGVKFGFYERIPDINSILITLQKDHPELIKILRDINKLNFYMEKQKVTINKNAWFFQRWYFKLFAIMYNNARKGYSLKVPEKDLTVIGPNILVPFETQKEEEEEKKEEKKEKIEEKKEKIEELEEKKEEKKGEEIELKQVEISQPIPDTSQSINL